MKFVASSPVGAPLAMSTLGAAARSFRAPATPSSTHRPMTGSTTKHGSVTLRSACGRVQLRPPSVDFTMKCVPIVGQGAGRELLPEHVDGAVAVRADRAPGLAEMTRSHVVAGLTCFVDQVEPPLLERATIIGAAPLPVNDA